MYYQNKVKTLKNIFGAESLVLEKDRLLINGRAYPIVNDVIILTDNQNQKSPDFARDIQFTFGEEWKAYQVISKDHQKEFWQYFDLIDLASLKNNRVCDLGCGNGRWSYFLKDYCKEIILIDFSDAIFVARKNLANADNCIFIKCDLKKIPLRDNFADFLFCLGVLHHLPTNCLREVRNLKKFSPRLLIYLYYNLDNRPIYFRFLLKGVTWLRLKTSRIQHPFLRKIIAKAGTLIIYMPLIFLGHLLKPFSLEKYIPLFEAYHQKSIKRIEQDVYDRFFTRIEQRVSKEEILRLKDSFASIAISKKPPYYHFLCS